ncbi:MAG: lipocalin family protein [Flavobacteriaceae bacterium]|jgi:hypothetical protein|nr:lipocalin family protein [Flavobacteriaceae bacterium]
MKNILLTALSSVVLCLSFVACSGDDDSTPAVTPTPPNIEKLIGKWYHEKEVALDANGKVVSVDPEDSEDNTCSPSTVDFKADGTYEDVYYSYYELEDNCESYTGNGKWSINGYTFTLEYEGEEEEKDKSGGSIIYTIIELSDNTFEIETPLSKDIAADYKPNVVKLRQVFKKL